MSFVAKALRYQYLVFISLSVFCFVAMGYVHGMFQIMGVDVLTSLKYPMTPGSGIYAERISSSLLLLTVSLASLGVTTFSLGRNAFRKKRGVTKTVSCEEAISTLVLFLSMSVFLGFAGHHLQQHDFLHFVENLFLGVGFMIVSVFIFSVDSPHETRKSDYFEIR